MLRAGIVRLLCGTAALVCLAPAARPDPDFSGAWTFNAERSSVRWLPAPPAPTLEIDQRAGKLRCVESPVTWSAALDGKSVKSVSAGVVMSTALKWEGSALLVNMLISGARGDFTQMDRWKLSNGAATLIIQREIVRRSGTSESTLVYERPGPPPEPAPENAGPVPAKPVRRYIVPAGVRIPLSLLNSVSTRQSAEGDRIYLVTAFPVLAQGRVVISPGSYVAGTLTRVTRPGRVAGRGELYLRFDSLTLPNGVTRDFRARLGGLDGDAHGQLDRDEGKVTGDGNKSGDVRTIGEAAGAGASVGTIAGAATGHPGMGAGVGGAAGAAAGLAGVLLTRGPDVTLAKGTTVEMILDRPLAFDEDELTTPAAPRVN